MHHNLDSDTSFTKSLWHNVLFQVENMWIHQKIQGIQGYKEYLEFSTAASGKSEKNEIVSF